MSCGMCGFMPGMRHGEAMDLDYAGVTAQVVRYEDVHDLPAMLEVRFWSDAIEVAASVPIACCPWCGRRLDETEGCE